MLTGILVCLAAVGSTNYLIDSRQLYSKDIAKLRQAAHAYNEYLLNSSHPAPQMPFARVGKFDLLEKREADCYVLGSSRSMAIDLTNVPALKASCKSILNLWVPDAGFEDIIALLGAIARKNTPAKVYIELRLKNMIQQATPLWLEAEEQFNKAVDLFGIKYQHQYFSSSKVTLVFNLFNLNYLALNIRSFYLPVFERIKRAQAVNKTILTKGTDAYLRPATTDEVRCFATGRCAYEASRQAKTWDPVENKATTVLFPTVDPVAYAAYETAFTHLKEREIEPVLVFLPYRTRAWDCGNPDMCRALTEIEQAMRKLAEKLSLRTIGSFDPRGLGFTDEDFLDTLHLRQPDVDRVFQAPNRTRH